MKIFKMNRSIISQQVRETQVIDDTPFDVEEIYSLGQSAILCILHMVKWKVKLLMMDHLIVVVFCGICNDV